jgi:hypothetical protein
LIDILSEKHMARKAKIGPILGIVGSAILVFAGILSFTRQTAIEIQLGPLFLSWEDIGFDPFLFTIQGLVTLICAVLGLIGAILALMGKKVGKHLLLIFGLITVVGSLVPMATLTIGVAPIPVTVVNPFIYAESILLLAGGVLALALKESED